MSPLTILRRSFKRRRSGKISALPEAVREQINLMIDDGLTYAQIIERLGDVGKTLNKDNLSRWRMHQHQDWLEERRFNEFVSRHKKLAANEPAKELLRIQREFSSEILRGILTRDPGRYPTAFNTLARLAAVKPPSPTETSSDDKT